MPPLRPALSDSEVKGFLRSRYPDFYGLSEFSHGANSLALAFSTAQEELVLRVSRYRPPYERDAFAHRLLAGRLPVPDVLSIGSWPGRDLTYAISVRAHGQHYDGDPSGQLILDGLDAVHATPLDGTSGWGPMDGNGVGEHSSWELALRAVALTNLHPDWMERARQFAAWDERLWCRLAERLRRATSRPLPVTRTLVHGDFRKANLLLKEQRLVAVLDWGHSRFGDPLYDCVWIDCWDGGERLASLRYAQRHHIPPALADTRLIPIELSIASDMLAFFAATSQPKKYSDAVACAQRYLHAQR